MQSMRGELECELEDKVREHQRLTDEIVLLRRTLEAMDRVRSSEDDEDARTGPRRSVGGPAVSITDASTGLQIHVPEAVSGLDVQADVVITFPDGGQQLMQVKHRHADSRRTTRNRPIDPNGSTAHVLVVLRDAGKPLDVGELHHEFVRRGWINPKWANPEGAIAQAARRAAQLGLIAQTPEKTFINLADVLSAGLSAALQSLATRVWTSDAEATLALVERLYSAISATSDDAPQSGQTLLFVTWTLLSTAQDAVGLFGAHPAVVDPAHLDERVQELEAMDTQISALDLPAEQRDMLATLMHMFAAIFLLMRANVESGADLPPTDSGRAWSVPSPFTANLLLRAAEHLRSARRYEVPRLSVALDQFELLTLSLAGPDADPQTRAAFEQLADEDSEADDVRVQGPDRHVVDLREAIVATDREEGG
jgi:hypothetical protein